MIEQDWRLVIASQFVVYFAGTNGPQLLQQVHDILQKDCSPCKAMLWCLFHAMLHPLILQVWDWLMPHEPTPLQPLEAHSLFDSVQVLPMRLHTSQVVHCCWCAAFCTRKLAPMPS